MTTTEPRPLTCPPPRWADLRDCAPDIVDDLVDLWARVEASTDLRWLVEHLGGLIETTVGELVAFRARMEDDDCGPPYQPEPTDPVFWPDEWVAVAPGRWEQEVEAFEVAVDAQTGGFWRWRWELWRRDAAGDLVTVDHGTAHTLADAQAQADRRAQRDRNWRQS